MCMCCCKLSSATRWLVGHRVWQSGRVRLHAWQGGGTERARRHLNSSVCSDQLQSRRPSHRLSIAATCHRRTSSSAGAATGAVNFRSSQWRALRRCWTCSSLWATLPHNATPPALCCSSCGARRRSARPPSNSGWLAAQVRPGHNSAACRITSRAGGGHGLGPAGRGAGRRLKPPLLWCPCHRRRCLAGCRWSCRV